MTADHHLQNYLKSQVREERKEINELRQELRELRFNNLRLRLDLQVLVESPSGTSAKRIRHRYNIKKALSLDLPAPGIHSYWEKETQKLDG